MRIKKKIRQNDNNDNTPWAMMSAADGSPADAASASASATMSAPPGNADTSSVATCAGASTLRTTLTMNCRMQGADSVKAAASGHGRDSQQCDGPCWRTEGRLMCQH